MSDVINIKDFYDQEKRITIIESSICNIDRTLERIDKRFDKIDEKFDKIDEKIDEKFDKLETKIDSQFKWTLGLISGLYITIIGGLITALFKFVH